MTIACTAATTRLFQVGGQPAWRTRPSLQLAFADSGTLRPLRRLAGSRAPRRGSVAILKQPAEAGWSSYGRSRLWGNARRRPTAVTGLSRCASGPCALQIQTAAIEPWTQPQESGGIGFLTSCHFEGPHGLKRRRLPSPPSSCRSSGGAVQG